MSAEYQPRSYAETLEQCCSFSRAKLLVGIYGRHKYWCISVVLCLLSSHIFHIYENITCKSDMVIVVNKNRFSGKMSAFTFKQFKMQFSEIKEACLFYKLTTFNSSADTALYEVRTLQIRTYGLCSGFISRNPSSLLLSSRRHSAVLVLAYTVSKIGSSPQWSTSA